MNFSRIELVIWTVLCLIAEIGPAYGTSLEEWQEWYFTPEQRMDAAITGPNAAPAGDGITNLEKFAFGSAPFVEGSSRRPQPRLVTAFGGSNSFWALEYRTPDTYVPDDVYYVPELSYDLTTWYRGRREIEVYSNASPDAGTYNVTISNVALNLPPLGKTFMRIAIYLGKALPSEWQVLNFGSLGIDTEGDPDLDGETNFEEFLNGTDPNDYFNGVIPRLTLLGEGDVRLAPDTIFSLKVQVNGGSANAPISASIRSGSAFLMETPTSAPTNQLALSTLNDCDQGYFAEVFVRLPNNIAEVCEVAFTAGGVSRTASLVTTAITADPQLPPPSAVTLVPTSGSTATLTWSLSLPTSATTIQFSIDGGATWKTAGLFAPGLAVAKVVNLTPDRTTLFRGITGDATASGSYSDPNRLDLLAPAAGGAGGSLPSAAGSVTALSKPVLFGNSTELEWGKTGIPGFSEAGTRYLRGHFEIIAVDPDNSDVLHRGTYIVDSSYTGPEDQNGIGNVVGVDPTTARLLDTKVTQRDVTDSTFQFRAEHPQHPERFYTHTITLSEPLSDEAFRSYVERAVPPFSNTFKPSSDELSQAALKLEFDDTHYFIRKFQYYYSANSDPFAFVVGDIQFRDGSEGGNHIAHTLQAWPSRGETKSPVYTIDPTLLNEKQNGDYQVFASGFVFRLLNGTLPSLDGTIPTTLSDPSIHPDNTTTAADIVSAAGNDILGPLPLGNARPNRSYNYGASMLLQVEVPSVEESPFFTYSWKRRYKVHEWLVARSTDGTRWVVFDQRNTTEWENDTSPAKNCTITPSAKNRLYIFDNPGTDLRAFTDSDLPMNPNANIGDYAFTETILETTLVVAAGESIEMLTFPVGQTIIARRDALTGVWSQDWAGLRNVIDVTIPDLELTEAEVRSIVGGTLPITFAGPAP